MKYYKGILAVLFLMFFANDQIKAETPGSVIPKAEVNLEDWNPEHPMRLKGKWLALPGVFVNPADVWKVEIQQRGRLIEPGQSLRDMDPESFPQNKGYATYVLFLDRLPQQVHLGLDALSVFSAASGFWVTADGL